LKFIIAIATGLFLTASAAFAGSVTAEVDRRQTSIEEPFWLTITVQGSLDEVLNAPESQDFEFVKTGESTNISIVNGSVTKERQYTFQVRPLRQGALSIPSFVVKIDGRDEKTLPIEVQVAGTGQQQKGEMKPDAKKLVFVERDIPKTTLYEGQAIRSTGRLLTRTRLTGATPVRDPSPMWRVIPVDGQRNRDVTRDGVKYSAVEMDEVLIPLKAGKLAVPQFGINASWIQETRRTERRRPNSVFDLFQQGMFNMGEEVSRKLVSESTQLDVKLLPTPKPSGFSDMVGAFTLKAAVSDREIVAGETVTLTIDLSGQGALDRMQDFKVRVAGVRVYDDKPELSEKVEPGAGLVSTKRFKFAVVPQQPGELSLGRIKLIAFNPFTERYEELSADLGIVSVKEGVSHAKSDQNPSDVTTPYGSQQPTNASPEVSALVPKQVDTDARSDKRWWLNPWILAFEVLALSLIVAWVLLRKFALPRNKKKSTEAAIRQMCDSLRAELHTGDLNKVIFSTLAIIRQVLAIPGQDSKAMTSADLMTSASKNKVDQSVLLSLTRVLEVADRLQYGGGHGVSISDQLRSDINRLIDYCQSKVGHD